MRAFLLGMSIAWVASAAAAGDWIAVVGFGAGLIAMTIHMKGG